MTTLREHLHELRAEVGYAIVERSVITKRTLNEWASELEAAIEILNNADTVFDGDTSVEPRMREIPDPMVSYPSPEFPAGTILPPRIGPGRICECGHTTGCDCRGCLLCKREAPHA